MKKLYTFNVYRSKKEEVKEPNEDGSFRLSYKDVKEPVKVFLKQSSRREMDDADIFYSAEISRLQVQGIMTKAMILNAYIDAGGLDSKKEFEQLTEINDSLLKKRNEYTKLKAEGKSDDVLLEEIKDLYLALENHSQKYESILARSAESIAERKLIEWKVLNFTFFEDETPVFKGKTFKAKQDFFYEVFDDETDKYQVEKDAFNKAFTFFTLIFRGTINTEEDFRNIEQMIDEENGFSFDEALKDEPSGS